jgi:hypothetical protein
MPRANGTTTTVSRVRTRRLRWVRGDDRSVLVLAREAGCAHRVPETEDLDFSHVYRFIVKLLKSQISTTQNTLEVFRSCERGLV